MNNKKTIIAIDDQEVQGNLYKRILTKAGYNVIVASSGEQALKIIKETSPDVIMLDLIMPGLRGDEVLKKIKQIDKNIPIIICSGNADIDLTVISMKYGCFDYIVKPFGKERLIEVVNKAASIPRLKTGTKKIHKGLLISIVIFMMLSMGYFSKVYLFQKTIGKYYKLPYNHPIAMALDNDGNLWISDWYRQAIYKHQVIGKELPIIKTYNVSMNSTGLAFNRGYLWTCNPEEQSIYVHNLDEKLSIAKSYKSPGSSPSGIYFDGKNVWTCDNAEGLIFKHNLDDNLTVVGSYKSPTSNPVSIFGDKEYLYTAAADSGEIFIHKIDDKLTVIKKYKLDIFPDKIACITSDGKSIWVAIDSKAKVYKFSKKEIQSK